MKPMNPSTPRGIFDPDVEVVVKSNYGAEAIYVVSQQATAISHLTGRKTVTRSDINALKALGFNFKDVTVRVDF